MSRVEGERTTLTRKDVLVVIPLYNHAKTVAEVAAGAVEQGFDVLVVDDGSSDNPGAEIKKQGCAFIRHPVNRGKGAAILSGAQYADVNGYSYIVTIDADGQFLPEDIGLLTGEVEKGSAGGTIIVGNRMMDGSAPVSSHFGRKFSNFWVRLESGVQVDDSQTGLRLYPVKELLALPVFSRGYAFEVEVLVRAVWAGLSIRSVPVRVVYPEGDERVSHFHKIRDNFRISMLHTWLVSRSLIPIPHKQIVNPVNKRIKNNIPLNPLKLMKMLCKEHNTTLQLAVAAWMGIFLGALPLIACHTLVIIYVTHRLHLNKVAAVASSQLCCPPFVPVICIEVGHFMRHGAFLTSANWQTLVVEIPSRIYEWFLGSLLVGPLLGALVAWSVYRSVTFLRRQRKVLPLQGEE